MSTSNRKSSSSGSRRSARGRVATPKGSTKLTATPRSAAGVDKAAAPKAKKRGLSVPKPDDGAPGKPKLSGGSPSSRLGGSAKPKLSAPARGKLDGPSPKLGATARKVADGKSARGAAGPSLRGDRTQSRASRASATGRASRAEASASPASTIVRRVAIGAAVVAILGVVALVAVLVMAQLPVFVITGIDAQDSEHVSAATIAKLAAVDEGTTLLSVDTNLVAQNVSANPWVKSVNITREFPDKLGVSVEERSVAAIVVCGSGTSAWSLGDDGVWIEPTQLDTSVSDDVTTQALVKAEELGCLLITNVPTSVNPAQGSASTDDAILDVLSYQQQLPEQITSQAQVYYAASSGSISLILKSGLEVSLGSATDVSAKAQALLEIMANYGDQLTYVNVRVPSKPAYRKVADGATLTGVEGTVAQKLKEEAAATATATTDSASDGSDGSDSSDDGSYDDSYDDYYDDSYDSYYDDSYE